MAISKPPTGRRLKKEELDQLLSRLADDREQAGVAYNLLRRKLINYFRLLGHSAPEEAADQTFDRTAAKLSAGEQVSDVPAYLFGVARFIGKEDQRKQLRWEQARRDPALTRAALPSPDRKRELMRHCFARLPETERGFLKRYYAGANAAEKALNKEALAHELQVTLNTLHLRVYRLRQRLRDCLRTSQLK